MGVIFSHTLSPPSVNTPFKELGIDSLGYISMRNRIKKETGVSLTVATIMSAGTIEKLAGDVLKLPSGSATPKVAQNVRNDGVPLAPAQTDNGLLAAIERSRTRRGQRR